MFFCLFENAGICIVCIGIGFDIFIALHYAENYSQNHCYKNDRCKNDLGVFEVFLFFRSLLPTSCFQLRDTIFYV